MPHKSHVEINELCAVKALLQKETKEIRRVEAQQSSKDE